MEPSTLLRCKNLGGPFPHPHVTDVTGVTEICNVTGYQSRAEQSRSEQKPQPPEGRQSALIRRLRLDLRTGLLLPKNSEPDRVAALRPATLVVRRPPLVSDRESKRAAHSTSRIAATLSRVNQIIRRKSGDHGANRRGQDFETTDSKGGTVGHNTGGSEAEQEIRLEHGPAGRACPGCFLFFRQSSLISLRGLSDPRGSFPPSSLLGREREKVSGTRKGRTDPKMIFFPPICPKSNPGTLCAR